MNFTSSTDNLNLWHINLDSQHCHHHQHINDIVVLRIFLDKLFKPFHKCFVSKKKSGDLDVIEILLFMEGRKTAADGNTMVLYSLIAKEDKNDDDCIAA